MPKYYCIAKTKKKCNKNLLFVLFVSIKAKKLKITKSINNTKP